MYLKKRVHPELGETVPPALKEVTKSPLIGQNIEKKKQTLKLLMVLVTKEASQNF